MTPQRIVQAVPFCIVLVLAISGCRAGKPEAPTEEKPMTAKGPAALQLVRLGPDAIQTIGLQTAPVTVQELIRELATTAIIKPNEYRIAHVSPRIPGKAVEVYAKLGDDVGKGAVLAELDSLELGEKKAAFLRAETDLNVARRNYDRERALYAKQISSERDYLLRLA